VFAQKGVTRSSTDQAFRELFTALVVDLERAWKEGKLDTPEDATLGAGLR